MRSLILLSLLFTQSLLAQSGPEKKLKELEEAREEELYKWRTTHKFNNKLPNDEYTKFYKEAWQKYSEEELKVYQESCKTNKAFCLSSSQSALKKSQVRVVTGLLEKKNEWARQGLSSDVQAKKEAEFKREVDIDRCATHKVDCDKLSVADRKIAGERTVKPIAVVDVKVEKPKEEKPKEEKPKEEKPKEDKPKEELPKEEKATVTLDEVAAIFEEKLEEELKALEGEFEKTHPNFKDKEMTAEVKNFLQAQEALRQEKVLEIFAGLCAKFPKSKEVCLSDDQVKKIKDDSASVNCLVERKFKHQKEPELLAGLDENHQKEWDALSGTKSCQALLEKKKPEVEVKKEEVKVVEENEDEKNPRNYKAETCRWVSDLPRKIVNGPGCGPKGRSRICTGYVVCEQKEGGGKFIRMSSCGADKCGSSDADAVRCTKDQGYFSQRPASESKLFMTPRLKKILSGASEQ